MEYTELEIQYSPSKWVKRCSPDEIISKHIEFATEVSEKNKKEIPCQLNVSYGNKEKEKYDIFGIDLPDDSSIFIYIHGGYWQHLDRDYSSYVVQPFYKNKIKTIVIGYTLCPNISVQEIVMEIQQALKSCIEYAKKYGSKRIYISGYSAGSQLIAHMFEEFLPSLPENDRNLFKAAILCCGIYDLTPLVNTYINEPLKLDNESAKKLSPMYQNIKYLDPLVYVVVGEYDSPSFQEQSKKFYENIKNLGIVNYKMIEKVDHFSIVENYSCENYELVQFLLTLENE